MARQNAICTIGGGCLLAMAFCSANRAASFACSAGRPGHVRPLDVLASRPTVSRDGPGALVATQPDPDRSSLGSGSHGGALLWSLVGLALAGHSLSTRRRECKVAAGWRARGVRRFKWIYGGEGPPQAPKWLTKDRTPGEKSKGGHAIPAWLTLQKWESFNAPNRARSVRWWIQAHDENGNLAWDKKATYPLQKAVDILMQMNARAPSTFDCTVELAMVMNLDPKYPDQQIRLSAALPHGTGKEVRVAVFCPVDEEDEVMQLGAHKCGKVLADEIAQEVIDFDVLLAKPQMMPQLAKLGKILGPRRLMPSPKSGTVVKDYEQAIKDFKGGTIELRNDRYAQVDCIVGKVSFGRDKIVQNIEAVLNQMVEKRPAGAKPNWWKKICVGATQSPSIRISTDSLPKVPDK